MSKCDKCGQETPEYPKGFMYRDQNDKVYLSVGKIDSREGQIILWSLSRVGYPTFATLVYWQQRGKILTPLEDLDKKHVTVDSLLNYFEESTGDAIN